MDMLHNKAEASTKLSPEGGLQAALCSNEVLPCSSPSGFTSGQFISEDDALDYLAEVLVETFLDEKKYHANATTQKGGDIRPSVHEGTG